MMDRVQNSDPSTAVAGASVSRNRRWNADPVNHLRKSRQRRIEPSTELPTQHYSTGQGTTFQISAAYSAIVRSLENFPDPATLAMALRVQASGSA